MGIKVAVGLADGVALGAGSSVVGTGVNDGVKVAVGVADGLAFGVGVFLPASGVNGILSFSSPGFSNHASSLPMSDGPALTEFVDPTCSGVNGAAVTGDAPIALSRNTTIRPTLMIAENCRLIFFMASSHS